MLGDDDEAMPDVDAGMNEAMIWDQADFACDDEPLFPDLDMDDELLSSIALPEETNVLLPLEKRFEETQKSLEECMRKSQETRMSLTITTDHIKEHLKKREKPSVVDSVQESARKLQACIVVPAEVLSYPTAAQKA